MKSIIILLFFLLPILCFGQKIQNEKTKEVVELKIEILEPPKQTDEEKLKEQEKAEEQETLSQWWVSLFFGFAIIAVLVAMIIVYKFARLARMR